VKFNIPALCALIFLTLTTITPARAVDAEPLNLLIRNVRVINSGGEAVADVANIRIRDGLLDLVSKDQIAADEGEQTLDAGGGYLLGEIAVGAPPKFMILNEDPVADIMVLLDTATHVVFAIDGDEIIINQLVDAAPVSPTPDDDEKKWLAYDPPPFALPGSISSEKWNTWKSKWTNGVFISALALDRQWISQDANSIAQFGDLAAERERGTIRGWRFGSAGTINFEKPWIYSIAGAWNSFDRGFDSVDGGTTEFSFYDFSVDIPVSTNIMVRVGKQKEPINMDRSMTMVQLASQERYAAADAMFPTRNVGVALYGTTARQRVAWAAGLFNDWLTAGESLDKSATQTIGRVTWLPFVSADESDLVHVGFGVRYTNAKQGLAYGSRPETGNMPRFVDTSTFETDTFDAKSSTIYNWELGWRRGPLWLMAEYSDNHVDAPAAGDPNFTGYHISGTWSLTGEMRGYRKNRGVFDGLPIAQSVSQGGKGATEVALRYSSIDLTDGLISGGEMDVATAQFNWWLSNSMAMSLNYRRTWTNRFDLEGEMDAFVVRAILILQ
jgi:phosphate-selective porin OprO and OprP